VVGTRKCSIQGAVFTKQISQFLAEHNIISVSGLAHGIDEIVHQNACSKTIGIMPCGFGGTLPTKTQNLCTRIVEEGGLLLSEFPPNTPPRKWRFIQRNRIIAWLASELILVEAPRASGALHTVRFAMEKEKKVWVVPSSPLVYSNHGGLELIAAGFAPLCNINQLSIHLNIEKHRQPQRSQSVMSFSEFAHHLNMNTQQATKELIKLEIEGKITTLPNGYFAWNPYSQS
jgi:DNA processing protein